MKLCLELSAAFAQEGITSVDLEDLLIKREFHCG